ncbi:MAG TPA: hypothetical protein VGD01_09250 [Candidatus Elarobacter sp.]
MAIRSVADGGGCASTSSRSAPVASKAFGAAFCAGQGASNATTRPPPAGTTTARACALRSTISEAPSSNTSSREATAPAGGGEPAGAGNHSPGASSIPP